MRYIQFILIIFFSNLTYLSAQSYKEQSNISRTFKISPSGTFEISNKYGSIYVDTWDKDSVRVNLEFTIAEKNENRFKKIKNSVNFDFSGNNLYRSVKTQYGSSYSSLFKDLKEATNLFSTNEDQTHVDYYITIPNYINLKIDNKYGNIILPNLLGDITVKLANGDLQAKELKGNNRLDLSFGNARISNISQGNLILNFIETRINTANNLTIESKSSDINIDNTNLLKLTAKRGKIDINKINYLFSETEFCELFISNALDEVNVKMKYGILKNLSCLDNFSTIKIDSNHADIWLKLPQQSAYNIKTSYLKANCNSNKNIKWSSAEVIDEKGTLIKSGYHINATSKKNIDIKIVEADLNID